MWKLRQKIASFMYGRYGADKLYYALFFVWLVLAVINIFVNSLVLYLIGISVLVFGLYRCFSRNTYQRYKENQAYLRMCSKISGFFKVNGSRLKDIGRKRYRRCKYCKATLRLPIKRGTHGVTCPRCGNNFKVRIIV